MFGNLDGKKFFLILFSFNRWLKVEADQLGTPRMSTESVCRGLVELHLAVPVVRCGADPITCLVLTD